MFKRILMPLAACAIFTAASASAQELEEDQTVAWSNATASGNGCPAGSASVTITPGGDEIAWTFDAFGIDLAINPGSLSKFCRLSASARIRNGIYLGQFTQELTYGGTKSQNNSYLSIGAQSRFFGQNLPILSQVYRDGDEFDNPTASAAASHNFFVNAAPGGHCEGGNTNGLFQSTLSAVGRISQGGLASLAVQGQNLTFKAITSWLECPGVFN